MDFLIGWQNYETEFNGHKITMQLRSLKRDAYMVIMSHMGSFKSMETKGEVDFESAEHMARLIDDFAPFFNDYVKDIKGFTVNGEPPTPDIIINEAVFSPLAMDIISQLSVNTALTKADEKNSERLSDSKELAATS